MGLFITGIVIDDGKSSEIEAPDVPSRSCLVLSTSTTVNEQAGY
jgi:hypothetical protein